VALLATKESSPKTRKTKAALKHFSASLARFFSGGVKPGTLVGESPKLR
jgi:hypothetical protein